MAQSRIRTVGRYLGLAFALLVLWSLLNCLGILPFPVINGRASLNGHLSGHFALSLPMGATVTGERNAPGRDPATFYRVTMSAAQVSPFLSQIAAAASSRGYQSSEQDAQRPWMDSRPPSWWTPALDSCSDLREILIINGSGFPSQGYRIYSSRNSGVLYIFWFDT